jgi:hypothetical protein
VHGFSSCNTDEKKIKIITVASCHDLYTKFYETPPTNSKVTMVKNTHMCTVASRSFIFMLNKNDNNKALTSSSIKFTTYWSMHITALTHSDSDPFRF